MSQATIEKTVYSEAFREHARSRAASGEPSWASRLREEAFSRFESRGFPTTDEEDWKYTSVAPIARGEFRPQAGGRTHALTAGEVEQFVYDEARRSRLVFVNGVYAPELSSLESLPEGLTVTDMASALVGGRGQELEGVMGSLAGGDLNPFTALNTAFFGAGAYIRVPRGLRVEAPVQLLFLSDPNGGGTLTSPRVVVAAGRESRLDLIESYASAGAGAYLTNAVVEVSAADAAHVTHYKVQDEGGEAFHVASTFAELGRDAVYDLTTITLGAALSRHGITVRLGRENSTCHVDGLYVTGAAQHADTHSLIEHLVPHCASRQTYKGILDGRSRAVFNGRVFVHEGARGTDAQQSNKNLLLSREARVDTKPQLEIYNDDVKCAHGATVGQLEEEELFYLLSRGLHPALARNLLTYGFAEEVIEKIRFGSIRRQLDGAILNRLHASLEV